MPDEIIPPTTPQPPASPTLPPASDDPFMKGLTAAANRDLGKAEPGEADAAFAQQKPATPAGQATEQVAGQVKSPEIKLTVPQAQAEPENLDHELTNDVKVPKSKQDWDKWRENRNQLWKEKEALRQQLEQAKAAAGDLEEVARIRKEHAELQARLKEVAVVNDPALTADLDAKLEHTVKLAKGMFKDEVKASALEQIMKMPQGAYREKAMAEFFEDVPDWQRGLVAAHIANADAAQYERHGRIEQARANADAIMRQKQQQAEAQKQARAQKVEKVFMDVTNEFRSKDGWKDVMANAELAREIESEAKRTFSGDVGDEAELGRKAYYAAFAPKVMQLALFQAQKMQELEATISKLRGASPAVATVGTTSGTPGNDGDFLSHSKISALYHQQ